MKKYSKLLAVTLCASIALASTGCGGTDKLKNAITNNKTASSDKANDSSDGNVKCLDYVTLGDYSTINIKKSEIDKSTKEQITKNIKSTGDYTKVKKGKIKKWKEKWNLFSYTTLIFNDTIHDFQRFFSCFSCYSTKIPSCGDGNSHLLPGKFFHGSPWNIMPCFSP